MKTIITLDSHQLSAFQMCPRLYYWSYLRCKSAPLDKTAFIKGTAIHEMLFHFYSAKIAGKDFQQCATEGLEKAEDKWKLITNDAERQLIIRKYGEYIGYYRTEAIKPVGVEVGFSKKFYEDASFLFIYEGKIDFLAEIERGRVAWIDHKTESRKSDLIAERNQFLGYCWAVGYNTGMINYIGLQESYKPKDSFRRVICAYKASLIEEWHATTLRTYFRLAALMKGSSLNSLNGENEENEENEIPPITNFDKNRTACQGKYSNCEFLRICAETSLNIIEGIAEKEYVEREKWVPYE